MTFLDHARAAYRSLERLAETVEPDPLGDLHRRLERIERLLFAPSPPADD